MNRYKSNVLAIQFIDDVEVISNISFLLPEFEVIVNYEVPKEPIMILTSENKCIALDIGDYIVSTFNGETYKFKKEDFEKLYNKIEVINETYSCIR